MVFTQKDIEKIYSGSFPGYTAKECDKLLDGITGVDGKFKYEVEPKVQAYIDLIAKGIDYVKEHVIGITEGPVCVVDRDAQIVELLHVLLVPVGRVRHVLGQILKGVCHSVGGHVDEILSVLKLLQLVGGHAGCAA